MHVAHEELRVGAPHLPHRDLQLADNAVAGAGEHARRRPPAPTITVGRSRCSCARGPPPARRAPDESAARFPARRRRIAAARACARPCGRCSRRAARPVAGSNDRSSRAGNWPNACAPSGGRPTNRPALAFSVVRPSSSQRVAQADARRRRHARGACVRVEPQVEVELQARRHVPQIADAGAAARVVGRQSAAARGAKSIDRVRRPQVVLDPDRLMAASTLDIVPVLHVAGQRDRVGAARREPRSVPGDRRRRARARRVDGGEPVLLPAVGAQHGVARAGRADRSCRGS